MQPLRNGTLYERMSIVNTSRPILQWMQFLVWNLMGLHTAISILGISFSIMETSPNKVDLDHALKIREDLDVGYEPYVRSRRK